MKIKFSVVGLDCPNCAAKLESMIAKLDGVEGAKINFLTEKLTVESALGADALLPSIAETAAAFSKKVSVKPL